MISYKNIKENEAVKIYIERADASLKTLGYTEHSYAHVGMVAKRASDLLLGLKYSERDVELVKIAAHLHDIGNVVNRVDHSQSGAIIAFRILDNLGMDAVEIAEIVTAIGNHDEGTGVPVSPLAAALIIADKSDVRRTRVRNNDFSTFDIHDRVNYSVTESKLALIEGGSAVALYLTVDTSISSIMDYFEIFLTRMKLCRSAAEALGLKFKLIINGQELL